MFRKFFCTAVPISMGSSQSKTCKTGMHPGDRMTLLSVSSRISNLRKVELEAVDYAILETIQRSLYLTSRQMRYLEVMEKDYGVSQ
ncbi:hypothetical protein H6G17_31895 [Chroococcidiopsis sp. FACHB-1243]|uniref:hypothetical protein n=1 Tax=Chroococcidiopsis sp. [FACHB-1243] TaxID=2692781 RepID=UPI0017869C33|nr:hypothetical protein [Chroococcidiopsis sp. [FACHB-1243]]MBD2310003.1 hypothetical protein [Chroococcidiopsis sp. [FACHB-1243]]